MHMSSGGHVESSSDCAARPKVREIGLTGYAGPIQPSLHIGRYVMATAEHREPCDSRGSRTVLGAPGGEIPPGDSTTAAAVRVGARDTPRCCTGVVAATCTQGKRTQHGKPHCVIRDDQPDAREGQAGRTGVAERPVVSLKPGNAGGEKGPQFKADARRGEGPGDWAT